MNNLISKYRNVNLIVRISLGLVVGAFLGVIMHLAKDNLVEGILAAPFFMTALSVIDLLLQQLGVLFIGSLRSVAPILVFFLITSSLMKAKKTKGSTIKHQMFLYLIGTLSAAVVAIVINMAFDVALVLPQNLDTSSTANVTSMRDVINTLFESIVSNPIQSIATGNFLGVLFWSIFFGFAARPFASKSMVENFTAVSDTLTNIVRIIIEFAPFGICGLVYTSIVDSGLGIFTDYGKLLLVYLLCSAVMFLIVNPLIVFLTVHRNPYPLVFKVLKESAVTAFFFRSSAANIPINLKLCHKLGLDEDNYNIAISLGSTINMEGAAITIITLTLACCRALGMEIDFGPALVLSVIATISAAGASGVSGGSILLVPMACSLFGITGDVANAVVAVGFIIGVVQDSVETALNSSTDVLFCASVQFAEKIKANQPVHKVIGGTLDDLP